MICRALAVSSLWLTIFLLGGCSRPLFVVGDETLPQLDLADVLPAGWTAIDRLHSISIDGDAADETLLFFTYDSGQVGATIFDTQISADAAQPVGFYKPYVLLPNYWSNAGQGFIAPPSETDNISIYQIGDISGDTSDGTPAPDLRRELIIRGGNTHLTFVWWREITQDYGVTQLYAPAGFRGIDWSNWQDSPTRIDTIVALYPFQDYRGRSFICNAIAYTRIPPDPGTAYAVAFERAEQGIVFCSETAPAYPFYPEGVVLAYLRGGNDAAASEKFATPGVSSAQIAADVDMRRLAGERIDDIATNPTIAAPPNSQDGSPPATFVCVELSPLVGPGKRWLLFTLRYQPPDLDRRLPERWTISGATQEPAPVAEPSEPTCDAILERGLPAPRN